VSPRNKTPPPGIHVTNIPVLTDDDDTPRHHSRGHRAISQTDAEVLAEAQRRVSEQMKDDEDFERLKLVYAEWFGADGKGGRIRTLEVTVDGHGKIIDQHKGELTDYRQFKGKLILLGSLGTALVAFVASIANHWIEKLLFGGH
jgi:hypothetical protein